MRQFQHQIVRNVENVIGNTGRKSFTLVVDGNSACPVLLSVFIGGGAHKNSLITIDYGKDIGTAIEGRYCVRAATAIAGNIEVSR